MILVVSYAGEDHTDAVVRTLEQRGRQIVRIDLGEFPARAGVALHYDHGARPRYEVTTGDGTADLSTAAVGWWRRVRGHEVDNALVAPHERAFAASETAQAVGGMLDALPCPWVNPRSADEAAHHKPYQWAAASEVGLSLPPTLVTNQPERAREFIEAFGTGKTVFKSLLASWDWRETRLIEPSDLERLESVRFAPVVFQEYVPGVDLRITIVGAEVYAAEIDATGTSYPVDMRMVVGEAPTRPIELPVAVRNGLFKLMKRLNLVYGAIDMRRTLDGQHFFLEVNPAGLWLFVEERTGLAITNAVAARLAELDDEGRAR